MIAPALIDVPTLGRVVQITATSKGTFIVWAPGDGLLYTFMFTIMPESSRLALGAAVGDLLVAYLRHGSDVFSCFWPGARTALLEEYVTLKLKLRLEESIAVTTFLNLTMPGKCKSYGEEMFKLIQRPVAPEAPTPYVAHL